MLLCRALRAQIRRYDKTPRRTRRVQDTAPTTDKYVVNHERIHTAQQRELLFIPFYVLYFIEWLFRLLQYRNRQDAYLNISFEREAYTHGHDLNYLHRRPLFAWTKYLIKRLMS